VHSEIFHAQLSHKEDVWSVFFITYALLPLLTTYSKYFLSVTEYNKA